MAIGYFVRRGYYRPGLGLCFANTTLLAGALWVGRLGSHHLSRGLLSKR